MVCLISILKYSCAYLSYANSFSERIYLSHRAFAVIDPNLREMLQNDIRSVFLTQYKIFFDKYSQIQFSKKNMEAYLKYPPQKIDSLVSELFVQV